MSDTIYKVGVEFEHVNLDKFQAEEAALLKTYEQQQARLQEIMRATGQTHAAMVGGMTSAAVSGARARGAAVQQEATTHAAVQRSVTQAHAGEVQKRQSAEANFRKYNAQLAKEELESNAEVARKSASTFRTYAELEQQYSTVKTKKLVADSLELVIARRKAEEEVAAAVKRGDAIAKASSQGRIDALAQELKSLRLLTIQREEVQKEGAGAVLGQLGVGRNITNLFGTMQSMFGSSPVGFGGPAMLETVSAGSKLIPVLGAIGPAAIASIGGVAGFTLALKELTSTGIESLQVLSKQRTAYEQAGVPLKDMGAEMARTDHLAANLSERWNVHSDRVRQVSTVVAFLGKVHGETNGRIVTAAIGVEKMTHDLGDASISAEQFAKVFEVSNPEREVVLGRLAMKYRDLADELRGARDTGEALDITMKYLEPTFKGLDREAKSSDEALERAGVAWTEVKRAASLAVVEAFEPALDLMSKLATAAMHNAGAIKGWTEGFIDSLPFVGQFIINLRETNELLDRVGTPRQLNQSQELREHNLRLGESLSGVASMQARATEAFDASLPHLHSLGNEAQSVGVKFLNAGNNVAGFATHINELRSGVSEGINAILINQDRMQHGAKDELGVVHQLTDAEQARYRAANEAWEQRIKLLNKYATQYDTGYKAIAIKEGVEQPDKTAKSGGAAAKKEFSSIVSERIRYFADLHRVNKISADDEIQLLTQTLTTIKGLRVGNQEDQIRAQAEVQEKLDGLRKPFLDKQKQDEADTAKQTKEDLDAVTEAYNSATQKQISDLQIAAAHGKDIRRDEILLELKNAEQLLTIAQHQGINVAAAETRVNNLRSQLRILDIKADVDQGNKRIQIQQEIEDRMAALISDPKKREARQAELKYLRDKAKIAEVTDAVQQYDLNLANEAEYQQKLLDIKESAAREQQKITQDILHSGLDPLNAALMKSIDLWTKSGGLAGQVLSDMLKKLISIAGTKVLDSIFSGEKKEASSKPFDPLALLKSITGMVPAFNDSNGPVGRAGGPIVNGKALVLADPMDWLIKLPAGNGIPGANVGAGEGEGIAYTYAPGGEQTDEQKQSARNRIAAAKRKFAVDPGRSARENADADTALANSQKAIPSAFEQLIKVHIDPIVATVGDFFKEHNDQIQGAAMRASSPLVRFGLGSTEVLGGAPMAATDALFGTHSRESFSDEAKKLRSTFNGTGGDVGDFAGGVFGAFQLHSLLGGAGLTHRAAGIGAGLYKAAPEAAEKLHEDNYAGAAVDTGIEAFLGAAFANVPHFLEHAGGLGQVTSHFAVGAAESAVGKGIQDTGLPAVAERYIGGGEADGTGTDGKAQAAMGTFGKLSGEFVKLAKTGDHAADSTKKVTDSSKQAVSTMLSIGTGLLGLIPGGGIAGSLLGTFGSALGFADGDYTGEGDPKAYAGPAHKREFYFDHKSTAQIGVSNLRALKSGNPYPLIRSMGIPPVSLVGLPMGGYHDGGSNSVGTAMAISTLHSKLDDVVQAIREKEVLTSGQIYGAMQYTSSARSQRTWKR
jgi:hypothetical protein